MCNYPHGVLDILPLVSINMPFQVVNVGVDVARKSALLHHDVQQPPNALALAVLPVAVLLAAIRCTAVRPTVAAVPARCC